MTPTARRLCCMALAGLMVGASAAEGQTAAPAVRRPVVRYAVRERVEFLNGEQWHLATVIGHEKGQVRIRTEADNAEYVVSPVQLRRYTRARSYPIKAAAQDVAAVEAALNPPAAKDANAAGTGLPDDVPMRPGAQPAEPEPEEPKPVEPAPEVETPQASARQMVYPLPPAPNALPKDVPVGELAAGTLLAQPDKVESRGIYSPDVAKPLKGALHAAPIPLRPLDTRDAVFEMEAAPLLFTSPEFAQAFVPHRERSPEADSDLYYDRFDLVTGQRTGSFAVPPAARVLDVSPDGTRILLAWSGDPDNPAAVRYDTLGVFVVLNDRLTLRTAFKPYASIRSQMASGIAMARFLETNTRVMTSTGNDVTAWDIDTNRAAYRLFPIAPCVPGVSANRKQVAVVTGSGPWLLSASTGQPLVKVQGTLPPGGMGSLHVSPDGMRLACLLEDRLLVWPVVTPAADAAAGPVVSDTTLGLASPAAILEWLTETYALVDYRHLVHVPYQSRLWEYRHGEETPAAGVLGGEFLYSTTSKDGRRVLAHAALPHREALDAAGKVDPNTLMAVHPGVKVSIDLSQVEADDLLRSRAVAALTARLQEQNGLIVVDNAPIRLVVTSTPGELREITYRAAAGGEATMVEIPEDRVTVALVEGGQVLWQATRPAMPPGTLGLRPGQTVEDYLAAERARLRLAVAAGVPIPKFVPHPRVASFRGASELTEAGPRVARAGE